MLEIVHLNVQPGRQAAFEQAFAQAQGLLAAAEGYAAHELRRSAEREQGYALLLEWQQADHPRQGFRRSTVCQRLSQALRGLLSEPPEVDRYQDSLALPTQPGRPALQAVD